MLEKFTLHSLLFSYDADPPWRDKNTLTSLVGILLLKGTYGLNSTLEARWNESWYIPLAVVACLIDKSSMTT